MRTSIFCFLFFITLIVNGQSLDSIKYKNLIKTYPLSFVTSGQYNVSYERIINNKNSFECNIGIYRFDWLNEINEEQIIPRKYDGLGYSLQIDYKRYFGKRKKIPNGWYYTPQILYKNIYFKNITREWCNGVDSVNLNKHVIAFKFLIGYQMKLSNHVTLGCFSGIGIRKHIYRFTQYWQIQDVCTKDGYTKIEDKNSQVYTNTRKFPSLHLGLNVGYLF